MEVPPAGGVGEPDMPLERSGEIAVGIQDWACCRWRGNAYERALWCFYLQENNKMWVLDMQERRKA